MKILIKILTAGLVVFFSHNSLSNLNSVPVDGEMLVKEALQVIPNITTEELKKALAADPETVLIDVRNENEINMHGGMINAIHSHNIPRGWLEHFTPQRIPDVNTPIVVYCGTNQRSPLAAKTLIDMGYKNVKNYIDGFFAWRDAELPVELGDKAPDSMLYSKPQKVTENIWSAIGATAPPTYQNSGHNNNLSFIITDDGVVVVNAGDNYLLAKALHEEIRQLTDQPVKYVILENTQGHAMLGSNYWKEQGAAIIAHRDAAEEIARTGAIRLERMKAGRKDKALGTELTLPDIVMDDKYVLNLGGEQIEILHLGPAHSTGDVSVWLPERKLVIAGDIAFHQRLMFIDERGSTAAWVETWDKFAALGAEIVVPGHGETTTMQEVTRYTRDYLVYMRGEVQKLLDEGKGLEAAYTIDQSAYAHLDTFEELARANAGIIFRQMEFE